MGQALPSTVKMSLGGGLPKLEWYGSGGNTYELQGASDFQTWTSIDTMTQATGGVLRFSPDTDAGHEFYRVRHTQEAQ